MVTAMASPRIAIVGAGIGGLATAIALRLRGFDADVYEAAETIRPVGAGILMQPNAMKVLARLGLADAVERAGIPLERAGVWDANDLSGGPLQDIDMDSIAARHGTRTIAMLRARLHDVLLGALDRPPRLACRCVRIEQSATSRQRIHFASGETVGADVIIGADGVRSVIRTSIFPSLRLRYSGQTSWRGIVDGDSTTDSRTAYEYWSGGFRVGFARVAPGRTYWFTALDAPEGGRGDPVTELAMMRERTRGFPTLVGELIARTDPAALLRNDLHDLMPPRRWWSGQVVLLGDAVHATTPNLGQGGAQALEDALALADAIAVHGPGPRAFDVYQCVRKAKAARVVRTSWWVGKVGHVHNPLLRRVRNLVMRRTPASVVGRQLDGIYTVATR